MSPTPTAASAPKPFDASLGRPLGGYRGGNNSPGDSVGSFPSDISLLPLPELPQQPDRRTADVPLAFPPVGVIAQISGWLGGHVPMPTTGTDKQFTGADALVR